MSLPSFLAWDQPLSLPGSNFFVEKHLAMRPSPRASSCESLAEACHAPGQVCYCWWMLWKGLCLRPASSFARLLTSARRSLWSSTRLTGHLRGEWLQPLPAEPGSRFENLGLAPQAPQHLGHIRRFLIKLQISFPEFIPD